MRLEIGVDDKDTCRRYCGWLNGRKVGYCLMADTDASIMLIAGASDEEFTEEELVKPRTDMNQHPAFREDFYVRGAVELRPA